MVEPLKVYIQFVASAPQVGFTFPESVVGQHGLGFPVQFAAGKSGDATDNANEAY
jgi:hypothetical protein